MLLDQNILKENYFSAKNNERSMVKMIALFLLVGMVALGADMLRHYAGLGGDNILPMETIVLAAFVVFYLLFPRILPLPIAGYLVLMLYTVMFFLSLYDQGSYTSMFFFWFAMLPVVAFYILKEKKALIHAAVVVTLIVSNYFLSYYGIVMVPYSKSFIWQILLGYVMFTCMVCMVQKEKIAYEKELEESTKNNKMLFKEIHHRTKNNMQVMMGLLETQSFKIEDPQCQKMLHSHIDRIKAMSFVHENLYTGTSIDSVDMHKYLNEILDNLQKITQHVIVTDIDYVRLDIKQSMSIGLLVNEAVSNSIEHAYSVGNGNIDVSLKHHGKEYELTIKDYGLGFDTQREFQSLGMTLIHDLSTSLPNGKIAIDTTNGTQITICFSEEE